MSVLMGGGEAICVISGVLVTGLPEDDGEADSTLLTLTAITRRW
jgi:hypothetical protein